MHDKPRSRSHAAKANSHAAKVNLSFAFRRAWSYGYMYRNYRSDGRSQKVLGHGGEGRSADGGCVPALAPPLRPMRYRFVLVEPSDGCGHVRFVET